jgi:hypothetical protein
MDFAKRWNDHLCQASRMKPDNIQSPLCGHGLPGPDTTQDGRSEDFATFEGRFAASNPQLLDAKKSEEEEAEVILMQWQAALTSGDRFVACPCLSSPWSPPT